MKVAESFVGQRVKPSKDGLAAHRRWSSEVRGTVVGFSARFTWCVRVLRDGVKTADVSAAAFWEPEL